MLKKIIIGCLAVLISSPVFAVSVKVKALSPFSTENPSETMSVELLEDCELTDNLTLYKGDILYGKTSDVVSPKRLKRDASFSITPETYVRKDGSMHEFNENLIGKYSMHTDKKELAKSASLTVGSYFVKGLSLGVNAVEGAIKNEEGNRFKSSVVNVYENTPFSYVETGNELNILEGDIFWLKFKTPKDEQDSDETQNYEDNGYDETPNTIPQQQF